MGELEFTIIAVALLSKTSAHVVGKWHLKRELSKGDLEGHFTLLFKKMNKRWVIVSDHSS
jgi:ketosteroid isomerase-like protein